MNIAQAFLQMAVSLGRGRVAGLPTGTAIEESYCARCGSHTEHMVTTKLVRNTIVHIFRCRRCGARTAFAPPPMP